MTRSFAAIRKFAIEYSDEGDGGGKGGVKKDGANLLKFRSWFVTVFSKKFWNLNFCEDLRFKKY